MCGVFSLNNPFPNPVDIVSLAKLNWTKSTALSQQNKKFNIKK